MILIWIPAGTVIEALSGGRIQRHHIRGYYWFDRFYSETGRFKELYIHIASPITVQGRQIMYTDHELDVVWRPGEVPEVIDEDEYREAI